MACKGDDDNTCAVMNCNAKRHKLNFCFQHYIYHYGPPINSFADVIGFMVWGLQEGLSNG